MIGTEHVDVRAVSAWKQDVSRRGNVAGSPTLAEPAHPGPTARRAAFRRSRTGGLLHHVLDCDVAALLPIRLGVVSLRLTPVAGGLAISPQGRDPALSGGGAPPGRDGAGRRSSAGRDGMSRAWTQPGPHQDQMVTDRARAPRREATEERA